MAEIRDVFWLDGLWVNTSHIVKMNGRDLARLAYLLYKQQNSNLDNAYSVWAGIFKEYPSSIKTTEYFVELVAFGYALPISEQCLFFKDKTLLKVKTDYRARLLQKIYTSERSKASFALKFADFKDEVNLTQKELADKFGVDEQVIKDILEANR